MDNDLQGNFNELGHSVGACEEDWKEGEREGGREGDGGGAGEMEGEGRREGGREGGRDLPVQLFPQATSLMVR